MNVCECVRESMCVHSANGGGEERDPGQDGSHIPGRLP